MKTETINAIREFTLYCRETLEREVSEQLEGIYGFLPDGRFEAIEKYPALKAEEPLKTRERLEQVVRDETSAGLEPEEIRAKLVKEAAFTWLNRLVALKMLEARKLIRQSISKATESRAFLFWLTEPGNERFYELYKKGDLPKNALGEGPRDEAYRHFILCQCAELSREIRVLFDPESLSSRLFPRPRILSTLIERINSPELEEAWAPGNEETIGWVYQFFNEKEKKDVFDRLYKKKQKIQEEDIPAATELFTPRWIVRWLVHNSLGRYWVQMHPDTELVEQLTYLVPISRDTPQVPLKKVKDIKLLDPACGTMHFGLVAFDLFVKMYKEELQNAGKPGWPDEPSVKDEKDIPASIIANNLYGLDIDLRAVQLSALALYLKAKSLNKDAEVTSSNLACADVIKFDDSKLKTFLEELKLTDSVYARVLKGIWDSLKELGHLGSLVRLEKELKELIEKEKRLFQAEKEKPFLPGFSPRQFETEAGEREFWEIIETQVEQALHIFAKNHAEQGEDESFFTGETLKGFQVMDLMNRGYDIVATNPPYMARRNMNSEMAEFLKNEYPDSKGDLYTAFIERCAEFLNEGGRLAMITQQSFMFISSYEKMRKRLLENHVVEAMCHVGPRAFETISGEKVNTTLFILRRELDQKKRGDSIGTYFRLVKEPDGESKRKRFELALKRIRAGEHDPVVFHYRQADFDAIPGSPWVYWITYSLRRIFRENKKLAEIAQPKMGMGTRNNFRFLRFWWEIGLKNINRSCSSIFESLKSEVKWFPYMKGGSYKKWYGNQNYCVNYFKGGVELKEEQIQKYPYLEGNTGWIVPNEDYYFRRGVTWTDLTSGRFSARLSPGGFIFDVKGSSAFPDDIPLVLGLLNSSFAHYALTLINPTVSFQVGDLARLPIPATSSPLLTELVEKAIEVAKADSIEDETTYDFIAPPDWKTGIEDVMKRKVELAEIERKIDDEVYRLYGISDEDRRAIEAELSGISISESNGENAEGNHERSDEEATEKTITRQKLAYMWVSYTVGIVMGRFVPGVESSLGRGNFPEKVAEKLRILSVPDGIAVMDEGHHDDLPRRVFETLNIMLGEDEARDVIKEATGKEGPAEEALRQYLERTFFKEHIKQYRKRPVYWLLQSPKKKYGIWVFHERMTKDTLFKIKTEYVLPKINLLEARLRELRYKRDKEESRTRRQIEREIDRVVDILDDIREFLKRLEHIIEKRGYIPHIDDGVLLNMAPLWELMPSWQNEPQKAWEALERGEYDWSYQAMDHWPERVKEKCKTNRSFAIAHGLEEVE